MVGLCHYQKECQMQVGLTDTSTRLVGVFVTKLEFVLKAFIFLSFGYSKSSYSTSFRQQTTPYFFGFWKTHLLATTPWKMMCWTQENHRWKVETQCCTHTVEQKNANVHTEQCYIQWSQTFRKKKNVHFIMKVLITNSFFTKKYFLNVFQIPGVQTKILSCSSTCLFSSVLRQGHQSNSNILAPVFNQKSPQKLVLYIQELVHPQEVYQKSMFQSRATRNWTRSFWGTDSKRVVSGKDRDESKSLPLSVHSRQRGNGVKEVAWYSQDK